MEEIKCMLLVFGVEEKVLRDIGNYLVLFSEVLFYIIYGEFEFRVFYFVRVYFVVLVFRE